MLADDAPLCTIYVVPFCGSHWFSLPACVVILYKSANKSNTTSVLFRGTDIRWYYAVGYWSQVVQNSTPSPRNGATRAESKVFSLDPQVGS